MGKLVAHMAQDVHDVVRFEITKAHVVKVDQDRHDLTHGELPSPPPRTLTMRTKDLLPVRQKCLAKVIDMAA
jgi:hypothetical protein